MLQEQVDEGPLHLPQGPPCAVREAGAGGGREGGNATEGGVDLRLDFQQDLNQVSEREGAVCAGAAFVVGGRRVNRERGVL